MLVDLGGIAELRGVRDDGDALVIGAMTHAPRGHARPAGRASTRRCWPQATATVADPQVRHRGTFGGALAHADPAGDLPAVALALDAEFVIAGPGGQRDRAGGGLLRRLLHHRARRGRDPRRGAGPEATTGWGSHYEKFNRTAQAWSIVGVAAAVRREDGTIAEARVGLTNMGATPLRAPRRRGGPGRPAGDGRGGARGGRARTEGTAAPSDATPRPTTASTWRGCSPAVRCSPRWAEVCQDARPGTPSTGRAFAVR